MMSHENMFAADDGINDQTERGHRSREAVEKYKKKMAEMDKDLGPLLVEIHRRFVVEVQQTTRYH